MKTNPPSVKAGYGPDRSTIMKLVDFVTTAPVSPTYASFTANTHTVGGGTTYFRAIVYVFLTFMLHCYNTGVILRVVNDDGRRVSDDGGIVDFLVELAGAALDEGDPSDRRDVDGRLASVRHVVRRPNVNDPAPLGFAVTRRNVLSHLRPFRRHFAGFRVFVGYVDVGQVHILQSVVVTRNDFRTRYRDKYEHDAPS